MPRAESNKFKGKDEYLIFVKNVPAYLVMRSIPYLYNEYEPVRFKNVYPQSDITTVVIGFKTYEDAVQAQQETDGVRVENVILRVEIYNKHQSVRYLHENRSQGRQSDDQYDNDDDDEEDEEVEDAESPEPVYILPFKATTEETSGAKTWASIARTKNPSNGMMPLPPPLPTLHLRHPAPLNNTDKDIAPPTAPFPSITTLSTTTDPPATPSTPNNPKQNPTSSPRPALVNTSLSTSSSIFLPWEPIDSTQRHRHLHARNCAFCTLRQQSKAKIDACE